ncbi:unnamed protein product [Urochloa humidicola]
MTVSHDSAAISTMWRSMVPSGCEKNTTYVDKWDENQLPMCLYSAKLKEILIINSKHSIDFKHIALDQTTQF